MAGSYARIERSLRVCWTVALIIVAQTLICGLAVVPSATVWALASRLAPDATARVLLTSILVVPLYLLFALTLIVVSPLITRLIGARVRSGLELSIADLRWPVLRWAQYVTAIRIVSVLAGPLLCGSPAWTAYVRWNGARVGRRVFINTRSISDHNLLVIGDDVVIGAAVHISGHTIEQGTLKTAPVTIGNGVTIGLGSVIDIGVTIGDRAQVGALSLVTKYTTLEPDTVYVGIPVSPLRRSLPGGVV